MIIISNITYSILRRRRYVIPADSTSRLVEEAFEEPLESVELCPDVLEKVRKLDTPALNEE